MLCKNTFRVVFVFSYISTYIERIILIELNTNCSFIQCGAASTGVSGACLAQKNEDPGFG